MITATVKSPGADEDYGFIAPEGSGAVVPIGAVERAGPLTLERDQRVSYELATDRRGRTTAVNRQLG